MSVLTIACVVIIAFLAGMEGVLDEFQFHQPLVACTLIGLTCGNITQGIILGGSLQLLALGWMNVGAAIAPDAALASVVSAILVCGTGQDVKSGIAYAVALAVAGLFLTTIVRTITVCMVHIADKMVAKGNLGGTDMIHILCLIFQGLRIAIPAGIVCAINKEAVKGALDSIPEWLSSGLSIAGGIVVVVGYAMVINMMATPEVWPFFFIGFALSAVTELNLIAMGIIGVSIALIYIALAPQFSASRNKAIAGGGGSTDELDDILNDF